jgi:UDP-GlcNAc:undecaprenyl-phosphate/decaprenyl-phosphate GlcNAc-1-phosphate transferase
MGYILLSFGIAALITYLSIPVILNIAKEKNLYDAPNERKVHTELIPSLGGIGIFAGFLFSALLLWPTTNQIGDIDFSIQYIAAACLLIFFLGLKDDIVVIGPLKKFIGQVIAAWIIVYKCKLQITSFNGVFGIDTLPHAFSLFITYFAIILICNAINLIDGVDGLSGSLTLICCICFALYFYSYQVNTYSIIATSLAGGVFAFLIFNYHPAKIFMGDTGSLLIGLVISILLIKFLSLPSNPNVNFANPRLNISFGTILGISFIAIPLFDTARVFGLRILNRRSPFSPDRNHIHHILLDKGFKHNHVTLILTAASIFIILVTYATNYFCNNQTLTLIVLLVTSFVLFLAAYFFPKLKQKDIENNDTAANSSRLINISRDAFM